MTDRNSPPCRRTVSAVLRVSGGGAVGWRLKLRPQPSLYFHNKSWRGTSETRVPISLMLRKLRDRYLHLKTVQFISSAYTHNLYFSHNFWNLILKHQNHTPNLQKNHTQIFGLWVFIFIKHFLQNTTHNYLCNTQKSNRKYLDFLFQTQPIKMPHLAYSSVPHTQIWPTRSTFLQSLALTLIKHTWAC